MKLLRQILIAAILAFTVITAPVQTEAQSRAYAGPKIGYVTKNKSAEVGAFVHYSITQQLRLAPEFSFVFRNQNLDALMADVNLHFPINLGAENVNIYPLAGLSYARWSHRHLHHDDFGDVSKAISRAGLNVGAGFEYIAKPNLKLMVEWKYTINKHYSTTIANFGVGFSF